MNRTRNQSLLLYATIAAVCAFLLFPVYWLFNTALSSSAELQGLPPSFWPEPMHWEIFAKVVEERAIFQWLGNSTIVAVGSVLLSMFVSVLAGTACRAIRCEAAIRWVSSS